MKPGGGKKEGGATAPAVPPPKGPVMIGKRKRIEPTPPKGAPPPAGSPPGAPSPKKMKTSPPPPKPPMKIFDEPGQIKAGESSAPCKQTEERKAKRRRIQADKSALVEEDRKATDLKNRRFLGGVNRNVARDVVVFRDCMGTFGLKDMTGDLMVEAVGGQAKAGGMRAADVITHCDGIPVRDFKTFARGVAGLVHKCTFTVLRSDVTPIWKCLKAEGVSYRSKPDPLAKVEDPAGPAGGEEVEIVRETDGWLQVPSGLWLPITLTNPGGEVIKMFEKKTESFRSIVWDLKTPLGVQLYFPYDASEPRVQAVTNPNGCLGSVAEVGDTIAMVDSVWETPGVTKAIFDQLVTVFKEERAPLDIVIRLNTTSTSKVMIIPPSWNSGVYGTYMVPEAEGLQAVQPIVKVISDSSPSTKKEPTGSGPIRLDGKKPKINIKPVTSTSTTVKSETKAPVDKKKQELTEAQKKALELVGELPPTEAIPPEDLKDSDATSTDLLHGFGSQHICLVCLSLLSRTHWDIHANGFKHQRAFKLKPIKRKKVNRKKRSRSRDRKRSRSRSRRGGVRADRDGIVRRRSRSRRPQRRSPPRKRRTRSRSKRRGHRSRSRSRKRKKSRSVSAGKALNMSLDDMARGRAEKKKRKRSRSSDKKKKKARSRSADKKKKKKKSRSRSKSKKKDKKKKKKHRSESESSSEDVKKKKKKKKKKSKSDSSDDEPPKKKMKKEKKIKKEKAVAETAEESGGFSVGDKVVLKNLRSTPKFNGAIGVITDQAEGDRWPVKITEPEKKHFAIKAKNLEKYDPALHSKNEEEQVSTQPMAFIGEWFVYKKGDMKYYYNSRTKKTTWAAPAGEERPMSEFKL